MNRSARTRRALDHYERNRERYRPLLENLAAVVFDPAGYFRAFRSFIGEEYHRRVGTAISATLLLTASIVLMIAMIVLFLVSAFLFLDEHLQRPALSAFLLAWIAVLLFFLLARLSLNRYRRVGDGRPE